MANNVNMLDNAPQILINGLNWVLAPFENLSGLDRPLWRDYSRWQEQVNFDKAIENGVFGMAARAAISWGYQDPWFPRNWIESKRVRMYRTSYHVIHPDQSVIRQADNWYHVHDEIDIIPRVIDLELANGMPHQVIAEKTWEMSNICFSRDGVRPMIYSRRLLVNDWLRTWTTEMLNMHYWWLAQYLWDRTREHPGPVTPPNRVEVDKIILHQTADKKTAPGEVPSTVDFNRWCIGNDSYMHSFIRDNWGSGEEPDPGDYTYKPARCLVPDLRVRTDPDVNAEIKDRLPRNQFLEVLEEKTFGNDIWCRIGYRQWAAKIYQGNVYIKDE
jgi:GH25 family lysozyme M1 (1,4-beta-N-acetylmuramidase)